MMFSGLAYGNQTMETMLNNFTKLRRSALEALQDCLNMPQGEAETAALRLTVASLKSRAFTSFLLPENGELVRFDAPVDLPIAGMRLPFPRIALEFNYLPAYFEKVDFTKRWAPTACIIFAEQHESEEGIRGWCVWKGDGFWSPSRFGFRIPGGGRIEVTPGRVVVHGAELMIAHESYAPADGENLLLNFLDEIRVLAHFASLASCDNVSPIKVYEPSPKLAKRCSARGTLAPDVYYVLDCYFTPSERRGDGTGTHSSPKLHLRRGHIRRLQNGRTTWVRQCVVGNPDRGVVEKDYRVSTSFSAGENHGT